MLGHFQIQNSKPYSEDCHTEIMLFSHKMCVELCVSNCVCRTDVSGLTHLYAVCVSKLHMLTGQQVTIFFVYS